ncbi:terminase gpP N-terminus-related DNA-binding protein [Escherichia coli]|uniref:phage terminase large subunit family protein n=1 Tax=Escherichia coli TaxID=562 RepID=UPI003AF3309A
MTITTDTTLLHDPRRQAALLYWQGFSVPQIAAMLQMKRPTVQSWKQRDGWDMDFATQAESIRKLTEKYNVEYIGIDATGLGVGVFQLVRSFYPAARDIRYTPEMKTAMVLKAKDVIRRGCLEYDVSATDITSSFMAIRKTMTSSGRSATYEASRSEEASHADLAWATMHALLNEPLTAGISTPLTSTILEFY